MSGASLLSAALMPLHGDPSSAGAAVPAPVLYSIGAVAFVGALLFAHRARRGRDLPDAFGYFLMGFAVVAIVCFSLLDDLIAGIAAGAYVTAGAAWQLAPGGRPKEEVRWWSVVGLAGVVVLAVVGLLHL